MCVKSCVGGKKINGKAIPFAPSHSHAERVGQKNPQVKIVFILLSVFNLVTKQKLVKCGMGYLILDFQVDKSFEAFSVEILIVLENLGLLL